MVYEMVLVRKSSRSPSSSKRQKIVCFVRIYSTSSQFTSLRLYKFRGGKDDNKLCWFWKGNYLVYQIYLCIRFGNEVALAYMVSFAPETASGCNKRGDDHRDHPIFAAGCEQEVSIKFRRNCLHFSTTHHTPCHAAAIIITISYLPSLKYEGRDVG